MHSPEKRTPLAVAMLLALNSSLYSTQANALPAAPAAPGDQVGSEFRVNTYTAGGYQFDTAIAMDADGDFVVAWRSWAQDGNLYGIYAQRYNNDGTVAGGEFQVNTYTTSSQRIPSVAMDADGDFVVAWESAGQDGNVVGVFAQRYNADGTVAGDEFQINSETSGDQNWPSIAMDADGDFVVAWDSNFQDGDSTGIYAQRYNADGSVAGGEFQVNTFTTGLQRHNSIAMDADGDFVIAWHSQQPAYDIYAQRYKADGTSVGGEFIVNSFTTGLQRDASIAMDADGDFVIAWEGIQNGSSGIYAQRYNADGTVAGSEFEVSNHTANTQITPSVAMDADGDFVVSWQSNNQDGDNYGIYAQRYNADGTVAGGEFLVNSYTTGKQQKPSIAMDVDGDFVVAWDSWGQDGITVSVRAQRFAGDGNFAGTGNFAVGTVDLNLVVTDDTDPVSVGNNFVYSLITTNNGSGIAMDVNLSDALPAGLSYVSDDGASVGWNCSELSGTVNCNKPFMTAAETDTIFLTVSPDAGGTVSNIVTVNAAQTDEDAVDNIDTETTVVEGGAVASTNHNNKDGFFGIGSMQGVFSLLIALPLWLRRRFKA